MNPPGTLIEVAALAALPAAQTLIVDCRFDLANPAHGEHDYAQAHIPGARYAHLDRDLADLSRQTQGLGRHPLPDAAAFSATLGRWGWQPGMTVVAYDSAGGALAAARLWWLLRLTGMTEAAVLDGGYPAWQAAGQPLESGAVVTRAPLATVQRDYTPAQVLDHAQLQAALQSGHTLLDARAAPRYRGEVEPIDQVGGHVPGALNRPFSDNLQADGRFKPAGQLRAEFESLLHGQAPSQVVHMCGSGVTACHNLLAMEHAGLHGSRLYAPSWSGWISDPARPLARG
jgi:thiosulfate/3-mercaptopyruvate sulfurtransferase